MKIYFAKYLPVEGEIKLHEPFFENDKLIQGWDNEADLMYINAKPYIKKAKLFLCSRDIQAGDDVYEPTLEFEGLIRVVASNPSLQQTDYSKKPESWIMLDHAKSRGAYKVIGEISTDTLSYVKEDDEFEEDQIGYLYKDVDNAYLWHATTKELFIKTSMPKKIQIKGPCGHFH